MLRAFSLLLAMLLPLAYLPAQDSGQDKELKIKGKLSPDDTRDKVIKKSPHQMHEYKMKAGTTYVIDLVSNEFDAFLRLENTAGEQLAEDDDGGGRTNARIIFTAPKEG